MEKEPTLPQAAMCLQICKKSKRGGTLTPTEHKLCDTMFKMYPDWYSRTEQIVLNETRPFGA